MTELSFFGELFCSFIKCHSRQKGHIFIFMSVEMEATLSALDEMTLLNG